jgi:hypothetical protein
MTNYKSGRIPGEEAMAYFRVISLVPERTGGKL